jgi:hypothetical protein
MTDDKNVPATTSWSRELVKDIAKDIGDAVVVHVETMYPAAVASTPSTFRTSLRNCIFNEILAAVEVNDAGGVVARIRDRQRARRKTRAFYRQLRTKPVPNGDAGGED